MNNAPRTIAYKAVRLIGWLVGGTVVAGLLIHFFLFQGTFRQDEVMVTMEITASYVITITLLLKITGELLRHHIPLGSRRAFVIHAATQTTATVLAFLLVSWLIRLVTGFRFMYHPETMSLIALVAFCGTLIGNGSYYMTLFYRGMRDAEHAALRSELGALRAQINPHFLFNSLNSIAALIRSNPAEAEKITESLADLFRYSLRSSRQPTVTLKDEMESVEIYLTIEHARFRDRLRIRMDVDPTLHTARVPSLLLQPLVENAVKHGAGRIEGPCDITIAAQRSGDRLVLRVTDTGPGFPSTDLDALATRGSGLANVRERLRLLFGGDAAMQIIPGGVEIRLPCIPESPATTPPDPREGNRP